MVDEDLAEERWKTRWARRLALIFTLLFALTASAILLWLQHRQG